MRSPTGYLTLRGNYLNEKQIMPVMKKLSFIISDRDSKLTNASYTSLEELVENLDTHNCAVNKILFNAWGGGVPKGALPHLEEIKSQAGYIGS